MVNSNVTNHSRYLKAALAYAQLFHWPVFPIHTLDGGHCSCGKTDCSSAGKHPMTPKGLKDATLKPVTIENWWSFSPEANIGVVTGKQSGFIALDIDPRHGGTNSLEQMINERGPFPDTVEGKLRVLRTLIRPHNGGWYLEETKTGKGKRVVPIPKDTLNILKQHKIEQHEKRLKAKADVKYDDHNFIFATDLGQPLHERNVVIRHFKPLLKKAGLPDIRLYDLRHTCATLLLAAGENPKIVSERLGHSSVVLTLDVYSHVLPDMQQQATEKLQAILFDD